jgi:alginate O-acetyltransferase complex protein AlgI
MVFSSILFIFYFLPLFFILYYLSDTRFKNAVILAGSIFFYAWGAPRFIFVILGTTVIDFYVVRLMWQAEKKALRTALLVSSLSINLGLLFYFKYSNFFVDNLNLIFKMLGAKTITWEKLILPIGISFYTFETITYVVDVYRKVHPPLKKFWDYQLYIILFPKLIAGPIIRFHDFADQIYDHVDYETIDNKLKGFYRFCIGLSKKVLIANVLAANVEAIFKVPFQDLSTLAAWCGALGYSFQIYFDFSGYSDMALGLGQMMGFRIPENFNNPYTAVSITDFWRRWHISLGAWMRNYLYIPLGGNRVSQKWRLYLNLWLVFLASGLWHGAAWGYVFWGAYHGLFLVLERLFLGKWLEKMGRWGFIYTFPVVVIGWVFFKTEHIGISLKFLRQMFTWHQMLPVAIWRPDKQFITMTIVAAFFSLFTVSKVGKKIQDKLFFGTYSNTTHLWVMPCVVVLLLLSAGYITGSSFNPFIYFRF